MRAIDTNVLVRYLTEDHPEQSSKARRLIGEGGIFVGMTVILESAWVLRRSYEFSVPDICNALRVFAGMPGITLENPALLAEAFERAEAGMDFADALHLCTAALHCDSMITFDRQFIRTAAGAPVRVEEPE